MSQKSKFSSRPGKLKHAQWPFFILDGGEPAAAACQPAPARRERPHTSWSRRPATARPPPAARVHLRQRGHIIQAPERVPGPFAHEGPVGVLQFVLADVRGDDHVAHVDHAPCHTSTARSPAPPVRRCRRGRAAPAPLPPCLSGLRGPGQPDVRPAVRQASAGSVPPACSVPAGISIRRNTLASSGHRAGCCPPIIRANSFSRAACCQARASSADCAWKPNAGAAWAGAPTFAKHNTITASRFSSFHAGNNPVRPGPLFASNKMGRNI